MESKVSDQPQPLIRVRIDRWLWAARFFKTRSQAKIAVAGGKVHVNGARAKPSRDVRIDDYLRITRGNEEVEVTVLLWLINEVLQRLRKSSTQRTPSLSSAEPRSRHSVGWNTLDCVCQSPNLVNETGAIECV